MAENQKVTSWVCVKRIDQSDLSLSVARPIDVPCDLDDLSAHVFQWLEDVENSKDLVLKLRNKAGALFSLAMLAEEPSNELQKFKELLLCVKVERLKVEAPTKPTRRYAAINRQSRELSKIMRYLNDRLNRSIIDRQNAALYGVHAGTQRQL